MTKFLMTALVGSGLSLGSVGDVHATQQNQLLLSISQSGPHTFRLHSNGRAARAYVIQSATDLQNPTWSPLTTVITDARGFFSHDFPSATGQPRRFFRLLEAGPAAGGFPVNGGLTAKSQILFSGGAYLDSFDSTDPNASTGGTYDPAKRRAGALAQTASAAPGAITISTGDIYGFAATAPGGTILLGQGALGDLAWVAAQSGLEPGHASHNVSLAFQDISVPFTSGYGVPGAGSFGGTNYTYVLNSGNYRLASVNVSGGHSMVVTGNAVLYVPGDFATSGSGFIYLAPGAMLQLYVGGNLALSGNGIINGSQRAENCSVFGLPSCAKMDLSGSSTFYGVVDAPEAALTISGSAGACGSFMADSIAVTGGAGVHYDESLAVSAPE